MAAHRPCTHRAAGAAQASTVTPNTLTVQGSPTATFRSRCSITRPRATAAGIPTVAPAAPSAAPRLTMNVLLGSQSIYCVDSRGGVRRPERREQRHREQDRRRDSERQRVERWNSEEER